VIVKPTLYVKVFKMLHVSAILGSVEFLVIRSSEALSAIDTQTVAVETTLQVASVRAVFARKNSGSVTRRAIAAS